MKRYRSVKLDTDIAMNAKIVLEEEDDIPLMEAEEDLIEAEEVFDIEEAAEFEEA